jgi:hypothetical protein
VADGDEDVLQCRAARVVRVDIAGDDGLEAGVRGEVAQERVPARVAALERALQLDVEALRPERARELDRGVRVADAEAVARAAGEADEALVVVVQERRVELRLQEDALLRPRVCVRGGEQAAEVRVALRRLDEERDVAAAGQRDLGSGDRADAEVLRRVCPLERAVDAVVVGERERLVPQLGRPQRQLLGMRRSVEERIR